MARGLSGGLSVTPLSKARSAESLNMPKGPPTGAFSPSRLRRNPRSASGSGSPVTASPKPKMTRSNSHV
jgi:hypothetical protein